VYALTHRDFCRRLSCTPEKGTFPSGPKLTAGTRGSKRQGLNYHPEPACDFTSLYPPRKDGSAHLEKKSSRHHFCPVPSRCWVGMQRPPPPPPHISREDPFWSPSDPSSSQINSEERRVPGPPPNSRFRCQSRLFNIPDGFIKYLPINPRYTPLRRITLLTSLNML